MGFNVNAFTSGVISIVIACTIVVVVGIPILSANTVASSVTNYTELNTMLSIIPILLIVGVIMGCIALFLKNKA